MAVTAYATSTELEQILSEYGVLVRADDHSDGEEDSGLVTAAIEQASVTINQHLFQRGYTVATLSASAWVKWCCAYLAVCRLSKRRGAGVPASLQEECEDYMEELARIRDGNAELAADSGVAAPEHDHTPCVSNFHVDTRHPSRKIRRVKSTSTGNDATSPIQQHDYEESPQSFY